MRRELRRRKYFSKASDANSAEKEPDLMNLLDLVALSTVCDVMPLIGLNRVLVKLGLKVMHQRKRPGIAALLDM